MDAILILLMPYNDRFQSDRVVQPFLVNDDRHLVFLTSLHRGVQSFPHSRKRFHGIPSVVDSCLPAKRFRSLHNCPPPKHESVPTTCCKILVIVVIQVPFHRSSQELCAQNLSFPCLTRFPDSSFDIHTQWYYVPAAKGSLPVGSSSASSHRKFRKLRKTVGYSSRCQPQKDAVQVHVIILKEDDFTQEFRTAGYLHNLLDEPFCLGSVVWMGFSCKDKLYGMFLIVHNPRQTIQIGKQKDEPFCKLQKRLPKPTRRAFGLNSRKWRHPMPGQPGF